MGVLNYVFVGKPADFYGRTGWNVSTAMVSLGDEFRMHRKLMTKLLGANTIKKTYEATEDISRESVARLVAEGGDVHEQVKLCVWLSTLIALH